MLEVTSEYETWATNFQRGGSYNGGSVDPASYRSFWGESGATLGCRMALYIVVAD